MENRMKEIRNKKNLTQEQLAIKSGVKKAIINNLEKNSNALTGTKNATKLADALGVKVSELFPD